MLKQNKTTEPPLSDQLEGLRSSYKTDPENVETASKLAQLYADKGWFNEAMDVYTGII
jgi:cytochrome c-type biogenesis protein CcmH/NrfG